MGDPSRTMTSQRVIQAFLITVVIVLAWRLKTPYSGIVFDALHYTALAFYKLDPETMGRDLLFLNGHATFSIFPYVYAEMVAFLGAGEAHLVSFLIGQAMWLTGLVAFAFRLTGWHGSTVLSILAVLLLSRHYGPGSGIIYAEAIATPRLFAEALCLHALALAVSQRTSAALVVSLIAVSVHPLMAGPALLLVLSMRWGLVWGFCLPMAAGFVASLYLAHLGLAPFHHLLVKFDATWEGILDTLFLHNELSKTSWQDISFYALPVTVLILAAGSRDRKMRSFARVSLVIPLVFCSIALVGEALGNVLIVNLHLWRSVWLVMIIGNLLAIPMLLQLSTTELEFRILALTLAVGLTEPFLGRYPLCTSLFALATLSARFCSLQPVFPATVVLKVILWIAGVSGALLFLVTGYSRVIQLLQSDEQTFPADALPVLLLVAAIWMLAKPPLRTTKLAGAAVLLLGAIMFSPEWDRRDEWRVAVENGSGLTEEVKTLLTGKTVYWEGGPEVPWLVYQSPSYFSCIQSAAIMFGRDDALRFDQRGNILRELNTLDFPYYKTGYCHMRADPTHAGPVRREDMIEVCRQLTDLDLVALRTLVPGSTAVYWENPVPRPITIRKTEKSGDALMQEKLHHEIGGFYIHNCNDYRRNDRG